MIKLNKGEEIKLIKRRHPIIIKLELIPLFILFVIALLLFFAAPEIISESEWITATHQQLGEFNLLYFSYSLILLFIFFIWNLAFVLFAIYYLDAWIVTNQRTIHTELKGLFNRYISSINHDKIQDVSVDVGGVLATYFDFGDLQIQTAGNFREFVFKKIPDPYEVKQILMRVQKDYSNFANKKENDF